MKYIIKLFSALALPLLAASCGTDNYDAPESTLSGRIVYNGAPIQVRGTGEAVQLQLFQDGWQKRDPIYVYVAQDGSFTAKLFDGEYKIVTRDNNGPWVNTRDTTVVTLKGSANVDLNVTPYFTITGEQISLSASTMTATCTINKIVPTAEIDRVMLIISSTQFADDVNHLLRHDVSDATDGPVNLSVDISGNTSVANAKALYGRIGVKSKSAGQAIYSPIVKLK